MTNKVQSQAIEQINEYESNLDYFSENQEELKNRFRGKYILIQKREVALSADSMQDLVSEAEKRKIDLNRSVIQFIPKEDVLLII